MPSDVCQLVRIAVSRIYYFRQLHLLDFLIDPEFPKGSLHFYLECIHRDRSHHHPQLVARTTLRCQIEWFSLLVENCQQSGPATYLLRRRKSTHFSSHPISNRNC
ncbi:hypothetical protein M9H77_23460 [Catharanthus roseus]|uniref:Uncharacterized protein n=1 Tax=Catharanthus roseus TaxID=4058 RepID=A0ACC0AT05_CATRO|nr:hypothetical protein M9H77_23460 [Catharanthus roseus]